MKELTGEEFGVYVKRILPGGLASSDGKCSQSKIQLLCFNLVAEFWLCCCPLCNKFALYHRWKHVLISSLYRHTMRMLLRSLCLYHQLQNDNSDIAGHFLSTSAPCWSVENLRSAICKSRCAETRLSADCWRELGIEVLMAAHQGVARRHASWRSWPQSRSWKWTCYCKEFWHLQLGQIFLLWNMKASIGVLHCCFVLCFLGVFSCYSAAAPSAAIIDQSQALLQQPWHTTPSSMLAKYIKIALE